MMILPLPAFVLDLFFSFNIALSVIVLLTSLYTVKPLDFMAFPAMLLVSTMLRLSLNVASTRVVLTEGHTGGAAAGKVIEAFGHFLIGGNYTVGIVVFIILTIINFTVVTKGAGRIAEVGARFALDAMPGKQMAIDADLNAGLIAKPKRAAPHRSGPGSRVLRRHGRRLEVRARRRRGRHHGHRDQRDRRPAGRHGAARHGVRPGDQDLHAAGHRRRPGGADPVADHLDRGRYGRLARGQRQDIGGQVIGQLFAKPKCCTSPAASSAAWA
jgi:hypothetical protein